jgi:hypothetical protein
MKPIRPTQNRNLDGMENRYLRLRASSLKLNGSSLAFLLEHFPGSLVHARAGWMRSNKLSDQEFPQISVVILLLSLEVFAQEPPLVVTQSSNVGFAQGAAEKAALTDNATIWHLKVPLQPSNCLPLQERHQKKKRSRRYIGFIEVLDILRRSQCHLSEYSSALQVAIHHSLGPEMGSLSSLSTRDRTQMI